MTPELKNFVPEFDPADPDTTLRKLEEQQDNYVEKSRGHVFHFVLREVFSKIGVKGNAEGNLVCKQVLDNNGHVLLGIEYADGRPVRAYTTDEKGKEVQLVRASEDVTNSRASEKDVAKQMARVFNSLSREEAMQARVDQRAMPKKPVVKRLEPKQPVAEQSELPKKAVKKRLLTKEEIERQQQIKELNSRRA